MRESGGGLARFKGYHADPTRVGGLDDDHPAVVEGRTLFPTRVAGVGESTRFLVSGHNNGKIGKHVLKGPWQGFPIFTLTLEERATCPRSCAQWQTCYGNSMQWPHRWDHRDPDFLDTLRAEIITLCRLHPKGLVVRLHVLGDFYSMAYLRMWAEMLDRFPQLHVYGYTAHREDVGDAESRALAVGIRKLANHAWDQVAIRTSHPEPGPERSIVIDVDPGLPDVIVCPAAVDKTATCGTCGLCWSPSARDKTIAFPRHGMKPRARKKERYKPDNRGVMSKASRLHGAMLEAADARGFVVTPAGRLCKEAGISMAVWRTYLQQLVEERLVQLVHQGEGRRPSTFRVFAEAQEEFPPLGIVPMPARKNPIYIPKSDGRLVSKEAAPAAKRAPDEPLVRRAYNHQVRRHPKTGAVMNPWVVGTADQFNIGTPEERIASLEESEKERIARLYGASFKEKP